MRLFYISIIILANLGSSVVHGQDCAQALENVTTCTASADNIRTCAFCLPKTSPVNATCDDFMNAHCPYTKCCPACEAEIIFYSQCTVDNLTTVSQQDTCALNCDTYDYGQKVNGTECILALPNVVSCTEENIDACEKCYVGIVDSLEPTCDDFTNAYCPSTKCCQACEAEILIYSQCNVDYLTTSIYNQDACVLDCSGFDTSSSASPVPITTTPAPIPDSPSSPTPSPSPRASASSIHFQKIVVLLLVTVTSLF